MASFQPNLANCLMYWKPMEKTGVFVFIVRATVRLIADSTFGFSKSEKIDQCRILGNWYLQKKIDIIFRFSKSRKFVENKNARMLLAEVLKYCWLIPIKRLDGLQAVPKLKNCAVKVLHSLNLSPTLDRVDIRRNWKVKVKLCPSVGMNWKLKSCPQRWIELIFTRIKNWKLTVVLVLDWV